MYFGDQTSWPDQYAAETTKKVWWGHLFTHVQSSPTISGLYSPRNDPDPEMIPNPEMILKSTPKMIPTFLLVDPEMILKELTNGD